MQSNDLLRPFQRSFIQLAIEKNVLKFGEFTLKSGRVSPYFFNAGLFNDGESLAKLGQFYANALMDSSAEFDVLFGPAYKGITVGTSTSVALYEQYQRSVPFAFNRKEKKNHGEGGMLVGAPLSGQVMIIDDVITAGTAIREVLSLIKQSEAIAGGVIVALDRQEKGQGDLSAIQELEREFSLKVLSIVNLNQVLEYVRQDERLSQYAEKIDAYRNLYGI